MSSIFDLNGENLAKAIRDFIQSGGKKFLCSDRLSGAERPIISISPTPSVNTAKSTILLIGDRFRLCRHGQSSSRGARLHLEHRQAGQSTLL